MRRDIPFIITITALVLISATFCGCQKKERTFHVGILQWTEKVDAFTQTYHGVLAGLEAEGYKEGMNLIIEYKNAEQDRDLALKIAKGFVKEGIDLIVSLGTGSSLAALKATEERQIPIVYSIVSNPRATGIIKEYGDSGRNITGVTMKIPVKEQFKVVKKVFPQRIRLGILYCTEMPQAIAMGREAATVAPEFGWTPLTVFFPKEKLPLLQDMVESLAERVDVIYLPPDPVTSSPASRQVIIRIADEHKTPLIVAEGKFVEEGALMAVHCDFYDIGRQASGLIAQVLAGVDVRKIPSQKPVITRLSLNLKKAQQLNIKVKRNVILKADTLFD